jgi:hypothetical protein
MRWRGLALLLVTGGALAAPLLPTIEPAKPGTHCVRDPAYMRRHHMELLFHQRTETVHQGVRGEPASLRGCIDCHASVKTGSVAEAKTDFCVSCHSYAAVKIDCFECHSSKAAPTATAALEARRP